MTNHAVPIFEVLTIIAAVVAIVARWVPARRRRVVTIASGGAAAGGAVVLAALGFRWQMYPVLFAALLALLVAIPTIIGPHGARKARRARWWLAAPGTLMCLALVAVGAGAAWALPIPILPEPSGHYAIGTTTLQWTDTSRPEPETADATDHRVVVAQLWYPAVAAAHGVTAQYLGRTRHEADIVTAAEASYLGVPAFALDSVPRAATHSFANAPMAAGRTRYPMVLFSPGLGGVRGQNTVLAEELASRGYVVVALDHPYDSAAVVLNNGTVLRTHVSATGNDAEDEANAAGWTATRAADLSFALTKLIALDRDSAGGRFAGRLDTGRVAVTGHSLGGAAAVMAASKDPRFDAAIDIDGAPHGPIPQPFRQPVLVLAHPLLPGQNDSYLPKVKAVLARTTGATYLLVVPGTAHLTFTDAPLFLPPLPSLAGSLGRSTGPVLTASLCAEFLDSTLRGSGHDLPKLLAQNGTLTATPPSP